MNLSNFDVLRLKTIYPIYKLQKDFLISYLQTKCCFALWDVVSCCVDTVIADLFYITELLNISVLILKTTSLKSELKPLQPLIFQVSLLMLSWTFSLWFKILTFLRWQEVSLWRAATLIHHSNFSRLLYSWFYSICSIAVFCCSFEIKYNFNYTREYYLLGTILQCFGVW